MKYCNVVLTALCMVLCSGIMQAQGDRGIHIGASGFEYEKNCETCLKTIEEKPVEASLGLEVDEAGNVYLVVSSESWYNQLFSKNDDGVCVDILTQDQFACGEENRFPESPIRWGYLTEPKYYKDFKHMARTEDDMVFVKVAEVPIEYRFNDYEPNLIILRGNTMCHYQSFHNLEADQWYLLDAPLLMATPSMATTYVHSSKERISQPVSHKRIELPLAEYTNKSDLELLFSAMDSVGIEDFSIKSVDIYGYSSVLGSTESNLSNLESQTQAIAEAMRNWQEKSPEVNVRTAENWVDFMDEVHGLEKESFNGNSRSEIKQLLNNGNVNDKLKGILKSHERIILDFAVEPKSIYEGLSNAMLITLYEESIQNSLIADALEAQTEICSRIEKDDMTWFELDYVKIPKTETYALLLNNKAAFSHKLNPDDFVASLMHFQELEYLLPNHAVVAYNLCALETEAWVAGQSQLDLEELLETIKGLDKLGMSQKDVNRLKINYQIIAADQYRRTQRYKEEGHAVDYVAKKYKTIEPNADELLCLSRFLSCYDDKVMAEKVLHKEAESLEASEELLYYYLSITITNLKLTEDPAYTKYIYNAINVNPGRFCRLFRPIPAGGVSFQILEDETLKRTYCAQCPEEYSYIE